MKLTLKNLILSGLVLVMGSAGFASDTLRYLGEERAFEVQSVFVPPVGYDDNDLIQVVVDGKVTNICWMVSSVKLVPTARAGLFRVETEVTRKDIADCKRTDQELPEYMKWPVQVSNEVALGKLTAGEYTIQFERSQGVQNVKFKVDPAEGESVDNNLYAPISDAFMPERIPQSPSAEAILSGVINTNCLSLSPKNIEVLRYDRVIVVLPKLKLQRSSRCRYSPRTINTILNLGAVEPGRYLLHVRSMSGHAINRVFTVTPSPSPVSGIGR